MRWPARFDDLNASGEGDEWCEAMSITVDEGVLHPGGVYMEPVGCPNSYAVYFGGSRFARYLCSGDGTGALLAAWSHLMTLHVQDIRSLNGGPEVPIPMGGPPTPATSNAQELLDMAYGIAIEHANAHDEPTAIQQAEYDGMILLLEAISSNEGVPANDWVAANSGPGRR